MNLTEFDIEIAQYAKAHVPLLLLVFKGDGRVEQAGAYTVDLLGSDPVGRRFDEVFARVPPGMSWREWSSPEGIESSIDIQLPSRLPQTWKAVFHQCGERTCVIGRRDAAEIEGLETNLVMLNAELSNRMRELHKNNAELERLHILKDRFLGIAAHDLRTPLGVIMAYSDFLEEEAGAGMKAEHREFVSTIRSSSAFMLALVNDLLDVATIQSGKLTLKRAPLDLPVLLTENIARNQVLATRKKIRLVFDAPSTFPPVSLDPVKFEQVMNNLLGNAMKFSGEGTTTSVRLLHCGGRAKIYVSDEGPGIPVDKIHELGQPFARIGTKAPGGEPGTGLGLLIVRKIIEGHGGTIRVDTTVKRGTTFIIELPLDENSGRAGHARSFAQKI